MSNSSEVKERIKRLARNLGAHLYTDDSLATGVDWLLDIKRIARRSSATLNTFFDVGANTGQTSREIDRAFPHSRIFAFEPIRSTFDTLRRQTSHLANVHSYPFALGASRGSLRVQAGANSVFNSLVPKTSVAPNQEGSEEITVETLDRFCDQQGIETVDVLKTDTEGYDLEVLKGGESLLTHESVRFIYTEVTFSAENKQNTAFFPIYEFLTAKNFRFLGLYETYPLHYYREELSFCNALFVSRPWLHGLRDESSSAPIDYGQ